MQFDASRYDTKFPGFGRLGMTGKIYRLFAQMETSSILITVGRMCYVYEQRAAR